jgi:hypothetical protein
MSWLSEIIDKPVQAIEKVIKIIAVEFELATGQVTGLGALAALGKKFIPSEDWALIEKEISAVTSAMDALHSVDPSNTMIADADKIVDELNAAVTGVEPAPAA